MNKKTIMIGIIIALVIGIGVLISMSNKSDQLFATQGVKRSAPVEVLNEGDDYGIAYGRDGDEDFGGGDDPDVIADPVRGDGTIYSNKKIDQDYYNEYQQTE